MCCLSVWQLLVLLCTCYVTRSGGRSCVGVMGFGVVLPECGCERVLWLMGFYKSFKDHVKEHVVVVIQMVIFKYSS